MTCVGHARARPLCRREVTPSHDRRAAHETLVCICGAQRVGIWANVPDAAWALRHIKYAQLVVLFRLCAAANVEQDKLTGIFDGWHRFVPESDSLSPALERQRHEANDIFDRRKTA